MSNPATKKKPRFRLPGKFHGSEVLITVRSLDGLRIVNGRPKSDGRPALESLHQFSSRTKHVYADAADGNPFADYQLVQIEGCIRETDESLGRMDSELGQIEASLPGLELVFPDAPDPTTIRIRLGRYGTTAARLILQADRLAVRVAALRYHQFIDHKTDRNLRARIRKAVRRLLAQGRNYRTARCTRHDLLARNEAARQTVDLLIQSGFIDPQMFSGVEDICQTYAAYDIAPEFGPPVRRKVQAGGGNRKRKGKPKNQDDTGNRIDKQTASGKRKGEKAWKSLTADEQFKLGTAYEQGIDDCRLDYEAADLYRLAAERGHARAQYSLGLMHYQGKGAPQSYREAANWIQRAAEQGESGAQELLGTMHTYGLGVPPDSHKAMKWFRLAAEQGEAGAQAALDAAEHGATSGPGEAGNESAAENSPGKQRETGTDSDNGDENEAGGTAGADAEAVPGEVLGQ